MDLSPYQQDSDEFAHLSLRDLLAAREQYHIYLMRHPNVVATALGRYRIRKGDSWPTQDGPGPIHGKEPRTIENSEVRPYSWPAILVFVERWASDEELGAASRKTAAAPGRPSRATTRFRRSCFCPMAGGFRSA